jgi:hypothetical protein
MLTVITSLRSQNRNVLEFMTDAVRANRKGTTPPSLLQRLRYPCGTANPLFNSVMPILYVPD